MAKVELILPLRNPTEVLEQTVRSITGQTDRGFSVLISDNYTTKGGEWIDAAMKNFGKRGLPRGASSHRWNWGGWSIGTGRITRRTPNG